MKKSLAKIFFHVCLYSLVLLLSCSESKEVNHPIKSQFTALKAERTGLDFKNNLVETTNMNGLFFEYIYNGGGVAIGDVNGDDLPDIYFISNMHSNKLFLNRGNLLFADITGESGLKGKYGFPYGVTMVDINHDGLLDIYISKSGSFENPDHRRNELYINTGNNRLGSPKFVEKAADYNLDLPHHSTQATFFDYDKDGDLDLFLINHGATSYGEEMIEQYCKLPSKLRGERLFKNENGKFKDVTQEAGIINNMLGYGLGVSLSDLNNDGWTDIYVSNDYYGSDHLYINNQDGTFKNRIKQATKHTSLFSMGSDIADFNNDGWTDILAVDMMAEDNYGIKSSMSSMKPELFNKNVELGLHHQYMYNTLQLNNGVSYENDVPHFSDIAQLAGVSSTGWSWAPLFLDMNNDGYKDIFISNGIKRNFRNNDFGIYRTKKQNEIINTVGKITKQEHLDSYISDLLEKMPSGALENYFYLNNQMSFTKLDTLAINGAKKSCSHGAAYADLDLDGDLDIVVSNMDDEAIIYRNDQSNNVKTNFLRVKLEGKGKNTFGIGSKVEIIYDGKKQILEQFPVRGYLSSVEPILHFGLGEVNQIDLVKVIWPNGQQEIKKKPRLNQVLTFNQTEAKEEQGNVKKEKGLFVDVSEAYGLSFSHRENIYNDFLKEPLLPHKYSQLGPAVAVGDINNDGREDVFIGGGKESLGILFFQNSDSKFVPIQTLNHTGYYSEIIDASFFDANDDGFLDLYLASGGNEFHMGSLNYADRLFLNNGFGVFEEDLEALPKTNVSSGVVLPFDFDKDGDYDLFIGGRLVPQNYPLPESSYILKNVTNNERVKFVNVTKEVASTYLDSIGMVTDAKWGDVTGDGENDLIIVGEWMPITILNKEKEGFVKHSNKVLDAHVGWWNTVVVNDYDNDGDLDIIGGNLGLNYKYKASKDEPFEVYSADFDSNGTRDIALGYYNEGVLYPLRGRECSSQQIPQIKKSFKTYHEFALAPFSKVYLHKDIKGLTHYSATTFGSTYFENMGGDFTPIQLPVEAQFSNINSIISEDFNHDGYIDLLVAGNNYVSEVETPRNDASYGLILLNNKEGLFKTVPTHESHLYVDGDIRNVKEVSLKETKGFLFIKNSEAAQLMALKEN
ncbi:VCBS repeat-containing protein [Seonamhaeicola sp.]|uniref:VCBS repeat-containing protein n=1 Tax=Seonamhaeicola sp. TaxID=1912245 RepID=UPI00262B2CD6|nr:VCBS repeat-containing protein [Seonamhaeicola sp.]